MAGYISIGGGAAGFKAKHREQRNRPPAKGPGTPRERPPSIPVHSLIPKSLRPSRDS